MSENKTERWTEIEHLPEWDEPIYLVYTAKKLGKWVMLKTLRPEYKDKPEYQTLLEKEFDVRYNLAHPNIIMINDLEDVPGLGRCIITDDVYGLSLRKIIDGGKLTEHHLDQILHQLVSAIAYIQTNHIVHHPIRPETIIFTENIENLKLIDVGFDQKSSLTPTDVKDDIYNFGAVLREVLDKMQSKDVKLRRIADKCMAPDSGRRYRTVQDLKFAIEGRHGRLLNITIALFLVAMVLIIIAIRVLI